jgi:hypothetical protein
MVVGHVPGPNRDGKVLPSSRPKLNVHSSGSATARNCGGGGRRPAGLYHLAILCGKVQAA